MGRLPIVIALGAVSSFFACNEPTPSASKGGRSEVVLAKDGVPPTTPSTPTSASAAHVAAPPKVPRKICEAELAKAGRALPKNAFDVAAAPGLALPEAKLEVGAGRWTWLNFFAAWCGPCKEEIPRLRSWEQKLASSLRVRFVSLDDDERQLGKFLGDQPATGVKSALWLKHGNARETFLEGLKLKTEPSLPAHALIDPSGKVRCAFEGAIDDGDYAQVESIVARR